MVAGHADGEEDGVGAFLCGGARGHGRVDAVLACLVGAGGNDASLIAWRADDDGFAFQFGVIVLFDRREECVHVHMQYCIL